MTQRAKITTYADDETKSQLKREADEKDMTLSGYVMHLIDRGRMAEAEETLTSRTDAEAAIERVVHESIENYHQDLLDVLEKTSVYTIANYELLATDTGFDVPGGRRQDAFSTGRRRTHTPLSDHREAMAADSATEEGQGQDQQDQPTDTGHRNGNEGSRFSLSDVRDE